MSGNIIQEKSYDFALNIVKLFRQLSANKVELVLARQILRSGTSVGANVAEMIGSQSDKDFLSKSLIAYKEARETIFWLRILRDSKYIDEETANIFFGQADEICRILGKIRQTMVNKLK
ncbi:MAG: four helix bundle protein [Patescibacteria group bacterium]|jgi:four helix bundle protein